MEVPFQVLVVMPESETQVTVTLVEDNLPKDGALFRAQCERAANEGLTLTRREAQELFPAICDLEYPA